MLTCRKPLGDKDAGRRKLEAEHSGAIYVWGPLCRPRALLHSLHPTAHRTASRWNALELKRLGLMLRIQDIKPKIGAPKMVPPSPRKSGDPPANSPWGLQGPTAPPNRRQWRRLGFPEAPRLGPAHSSAGRPLAARFSSAPVPGDPRGTFSAEGLLAMAGAGSAAVSGAGTPVAGPAGRDLFAEGLLEFLRPAVQQLDSHVHAVRESQVELREQIDNLATVSSDRPMWVQACLHPTDQPAFPKNEEPLGVSLQLTSIPQSCAESTRIRKWPWISTPMSRSCLMPGDELSWSTTFCRMRRNG
ncbi:SNARE-associated protein Snapin isoform X3 [Felis catus]|nr:SNARE-associated protein Snapin isoform X3 [Felis catus]